MCLYVCAWTCVCVCAPVTVSQATHTGDLLWKLREQFIGIPHEVFSLHKWAILMFSCALSTIREKHYIYLFAKSSNCHTWTSRKTIPPVVSIIWLLEGLKEYKWDNSKLEQNQNQQEAASGLTVEQRLCLLQLQFTGSHPLRRTPCLLSMLQLRRSAQHRLIFRHRLVKRCLSNICLRSSTGLWHRTCNSDYT